VTRNYRWAGWLGLLATIIVGLGETLLQFNPAANVADQTGYVFFADIPTWRLTWGHFLAVCGAPLYIAGYAWLAYMIRPAGSKRAGWFFALGAMAFMIGAVWIGQRAFIATAVQADLGPTLLARFKDLHEPLAHILRGLVLLISGLWVWAVWSRHTSFPRRIALAAPIVPLSVIFGLYSSGLNLGDYVFPAAMNVAHFILFGAALWTTRNVAANG